MIQVPGPGYPRSYEGVVLVDPATGLPYTAATGGDGAPTLDRELVVSTYLCKTAFTGASGGDTITATQVLDVTGAPYTVSTVWRNQTTAVDLGSAPPAANLELTGATALTDAQLRAAAVTVSASARVCLGTERVTVTSTAATLKSLMTGAAFPVGTVVVELQADGGTVRIRRDNANPTTTLGYRLDDGMVLTVDSAPASVRVIAAVSTPMNVACFDRV